ncbi:hypothetical protein ACLBXB_25820 [Methylobacterium mesophilicum]
MANAIDTLDVPVEVLWGFVEASDEQRLLMQDCAELMDAFRGIADQKSRRRCIMFTRNEAEIFQ